MPIQRNTSRRYFVETLLPHYEQFLEYYETGEMGLGRDIKNSAAVAEDCLNLSEALFWEERISLKKVGVRSEASYREHLWKSAPFYQYVCDFANANKHRELRQGRKIATIDDAQVVCGVIRYKDKQGFYYGVRKHLRLQCLDGQTRDLGQMILDSVEMWIGELLSRKKIDRRPKIRKPTPKFRTRNELSEPLKIKFLGQRQERFSECFKNLIYDPAADSFRDAGPKDRFKFNIQCTVQIEKSPFD